MTTKETQTKTTKPALSDEELAAIKAKAKAVAEAEAAAKTEAEAAVKQAAEDARYGGPPPEEGWKAGIKGARHGHMEHVSMMGKKRGQQPVAAPDKPTNPLSIDLSGGPG